MQIQLGQRLQAARAERGLSLLDAAHATRIPAARLQDLESGNYTNLGGLAYTRGHLKAYAAYLDVDADEVLSHIGIPPMAGKRDYMYLLRSYGRWLPGRDRSTLRPREGRGEPARVSRVPMRSIKVLTFASGSLLLLCAGMVLGNVLFRVGADKTVADQKDIVVRKAEVPPPRAILVTDSGEPIVSQKSFSGTPQLQETIIPALPATVDVQPISAAGNALSTTPFVPPKALPVVDDEPISQNRRNSRSVR